MVAIGLDVEEIVNNVGGRGAEAKGEKGDGGSGEEAKGAAVCKQERKEEENVFGPLVETDRPEPGFEGWRGLGEGAEQGDVCGTKAGAEGASGVGDHGLNAGAEQGEIRAGVADVAEFVAKALMKGGQLGRSGEVGRTIGREDAREQAEVVGDALGKGEVCCRGEIDEPARGVLLLKKLEELAIVGKVNDVQLDRRGDVALESGLTL